MSVPEEQQLAALADKFLAGTATTAEQEQLHLLYDKWMDDEEIVVTATEQTEVMRLEILQAIKDRINAQRKFIPFYKRKSWRLMAAASILIVAGVLLFYYTQPASHKSEFASKQGGLQTDQSPVVPGKDRATLTLANGTVIDLDSSAAGLLAQQGNTSILNKDGKIIYDPRTAGSGETIYNTISTPRGGQYQLVLPDGTKVWLNAISTLKFPVAFTGKNRTVELTGEAYFEVAKNRAMPFHVIVPPQPGVTSGAEVEVIGTHFNIMAYNEEQAIKTTLLEGSVKVSNQESAIGNPRRAGAGWQSAILKPGEQVSISHSSQTQASQLSQPILVQTEEVLSWKNGKFHFNNADIKVIMRQIARWYDVEVEYRNVSSETQLGGIVSRKEDLRQLLNYFEIAGKVKFTVEGRKIIVSQIKS